MVNPALPTGENSKQRGPKRRKLTQQCQTQVQESKSFKKRSETVIKKAWELVDRCKAQVCIVAYNGPHSNVEVWPKDQDMAEAIINKFRKATGTKNMTRSREVNLSRFLETRIKELEQNIGLDDKELDKLSGESLMGLSTFLESKIQKLGDTIKSMEGKSRVDLPHGGQSLSNCNLVHKQLQQQSNPLGFNATCSGNRIPRGFEGQTQTQNYNFLDNCFQFGFENCSNNYMMRGLEGQSDFGTFGSSSSGQWGLSQDNFHFGNLMGIDYQNYVFREQQRSMAFANADNFNQLINRRPSQQFPVIPQPITSPLNETLPISFRPLPLQVQMI